MKEENKSFSLESIDFIFYHPWLFLIPILTIFSITFTVVNNTRLDYQARAVLSFENPGGTIIDSKFTQKRTDLIGRILLGDNIKNIIKEVWPELKESREPIKYNDRIESLRSPKDGLKLVYDRTDPRLLSVSFINKDPKVCYKVVKATVDIIQKENKEVSSKDLEAGMAFLTKQVDFYKNKLKSVDEESASMVAELRRSMPELSDNEKEVSKH